MPLILFHLATICLCFFLVWFGAGKAVETVVKISQRWRLPAFTVSFFLLGVMTSLPEIAIGFLAVSQGTPHVFAGNLLGAVLVLLLLIIPLLALFGKGVKFPHHQISQPELLAILAVIVAPSILAADTLISALEGWLMLALYGTLFGVLTFRHHWTEKVAQKVRRPPTLKWTELASGIFGIVVLVLASRQIVDSTLFFADVLKISPFVVSVLLVACGTNIPEFSLIIRSILLKRTDIALADYLGSASANTLLFGFFTVIHQESFVLPGDTTLRLLFILFSFVLFFVFARSRNTLSRREGSLLLAMYVLFVLTELWQS